MPRLSRRRLLAAVLACSSAGCGTILYPERRGQSKGPLDWGVVALDGIGLILFFVPGVIAFAVDFATGAIYLPTDPYYGASAAPAGSPAVPPGLVTLQVPREDLTTDRLSARLSRRLGRPVDLSAPGCRRIPLDSVDQFRAATDRLIAAASLPGDSEPRVLRAQSPSR